MSLSLHNFFLLEQIIQGEGSSVPKEKITRAKEMDEGLRAA